uniref:Uncharacterized protein n=1 Tax=Hyaloperonospora arabidopsidis (strain Emoy2) TaxID=559515 RepID=M4C4S1_HYAAE
MYKTEAGRDGVPRLTMEFRRRSEAPPRAPRARRPRLACGGFNSGQRAQAKWMDHESITRFLFR